ncbi:EAL domain-containing protein [Bradyrhizobium sp. CB1015]|uniref:bifunctional diguanylate cyclase/phosphodiesterase n=1 Tax=Bradyrhizobium sp. CB1015 TaxID=2976822 RepID=UPI0021A999E4|nr:EAL domain-containing protein [Bradyrhizobium sp. CB1015]UWU91372.1 EAL domain-containing protein [Bradyrhizobium sp. CB1015]
MSTEDRNDKFRQAPSDGTERTGWPTHFVAVFWISFGGLSLIAAIIAVTALMIGHLREQELEKNRNALRNTVVLLARHFDQRFTGFEAVERSLATELGQQIASPDQFATAVSSENFHKLLRSRINDSGDLGEVSLYDSEGNCVASSVAWPVERTNIADRRYFQSFTTAPASSPTAIELVHNGSSPAIVVARKIVAQNGQLLGLVTKRVAAEDVESFLAAIAPPNAALSLFHQNGTLLARSPRETRSLGQDFSASPLYAAAAANGGQVTAQFISPFDGVERIASVRYLDHYPLAVLATITTSTVLSDWLGQARLYGFGAAAIAAVALLTLGFVVHHLRRQHQHLEMAVNNMKQGLLLFDRSERLIICNRSYIDMFGLSPQLVKPGCSLQAIIAHRLETGSLVGSVDMHCEPIRAAAKRGIATQALARTRDGRWMQIMNQPVARGGWVSTIEDVTEQREYQERISRLANYDLVTELPNRSYFLERLETELRDCSTTKVALLFLDIDEFKSVNDLLGHHVGDALLRNIGRALQDCLAPGDFLARLGGDEFAVLTRYSGEESAVEPFLAKIYASLRTSHGCGGFNLAVDASIGVAIAPLHGRTSEQLLQNADLAMYEAKSSGKRGFRFFEPGMERRARDRRMLEQDLRRALDRAEIEVHFQPLVGLATGAITGFEALARWNHPERGVVSPAEFIPVAEQSGLIELLGEHVLRVACKQAATWPAQIKVAVNVSPAQFKTGVLPLKVASALAAAGLMPGRLELEITEAVLIKDDHSALETLHQLRALGVRLALDDFGTGYSSLSYLSKFPFDKIKIDRSFVATLTEGRKSIGIVRAVIALAAEHQMATTAEGVETEQQRDILRALECDEFQGFLVSSARPAAEIAAMLEAAQNEHAAA